MLLFTWSRGRVCRCCRRGGFCCDRRRRFHRCWGAARACRKGALDRVFHGVRYRSAVRENIAIYTLTDVGGRQSGPGGYSYLEAVLQEKITQLKVSGYTEVQVQVIDEAVRRVIQIKRNAYPALVGCVLREGA